MASAQYRGHLQWPDNRDRQPDEQVAEAWDVLDRSGAVPAVEPAALSSKKRVVEFAEVIIAPEAERQCVLGFVG